MNPETNKTFSVPSGIQPRCLRWCRHASNGDISVVVADHETAAPESVEHALRRVGREPDGRCDIVACPGAELGDRVPRLPLIDIYNADEARHAIRLSRDHGELSPLRP